ncbi:glycosyltransferase family A protein [Microbacterium esteraromaticum]|uniref:glycosyltransferase family 2 protein n=1 Tax=Microbacterium esteraromaticum TaxID=57043 RepID=UPI00236826DE|nr:glycosyltransferase family A protein [Microbacterium esteraromaticum]WDH79454.1 glycosyltransferase family A protein [Microbacterium esteraromaticum]
MSKTSLRLETRIGIVIPTYNVGRFVVDAAHSARTALGGCDNVCVVDDGSTGRETLGALRELKRDGFQVLRQSNQGVSAARNSGIALLATPYAIALDADDLIEPAAPRLIADAFDRDPASVIVTGAGINFSDGHQSDPVSPGNQDRRSMWSSSMIATASGFRVADWKRVGGFPQGVAIGEDWVFWLRLLRDGGRVTTLDEVVVRHRFHSGQVTHRVRDPRLLTKARALVLRENPDLVAANMDQLVDELISTREVLAAYRYAYRHIDTVKSRLRGWLRR